MLKLVFVSKKKKNSQSSLLQMSVEHGSMSYFYHHDCMKCKKNPLMSYFRSGVEHRAAFRVITTTFSYYLCRSIMLEGLFCTSNIQYSHLKIYFVS